MIDQTYGNLAPREFALGIIQRLEQTHNVQLQAMLDNDALSTSQKRQLMTTRLLESIWGGLDGHNAGAQIEAPVTEHEERLVAQLEDTQTGAGLQATEVEIEPNVIVSEHNANIIRGYQGQELYDYVYSLTKRFENMAASKTEGQLAIEMVAGGVTSVSIPMAVGTVKALRGGAQLLAAVKTGIKGLGMKTAIAVVVVILVALLLFLLLDNPKKILGMVFNDTDESWDVTDWRKGIDGAVGSDLYMAHGVMESFPEDHETGDLDSPKVQLRKRFYFGPGDEDNQVCAGVYFADRNIGLRGSEGIMLFTSREKQSVIAHQFAVPYTNDNGTNIRVLTSRPAPKDLPNLYREMYDTRKVRIATTEHGYNMTSTVNDARGGVVALVASIRSA